MKKITIISSLVFGLLWGVSAQGQEMPAGAVVRTLNCSLNEGTSMADAVAWGRNISRDENSANSVFFRQAIHHTNFRDEFDFRIAWYYGSYSEYIMKMEANRNNSSRTRPNPPPGDLMTCDPGSDAVSISRQIPDTDAFTGNNTLMMTRFCRLDEGNSVADAYSFLSGVVRNFRAGGNNALVQVNSRSLGPVENRQGNAVVIAEVAATAEDLGSRLDLSLNGLNPTEGLSNPFTICNFPALWRTHAIYRAAN